MKYVVLIGDGMSDEPMAELNGKTPLMVAATPNLDRMVRNGIGGWCRITPEVYSPGSDVANLGVLGYDVRDCYTGRSPLEAAISICWLNCHCAPRGSNENHRTAATAAARSAAPSAA